MYNTNGVVGKNLEGLNKRNIILSKKNAELVKFRQKQDILRIMNQILATKNNELESKYKKIKEYGGTKRK